ncbi:uncharacterized protein LOC123318850 isoform X2 [Coccinella septempunctata]|uniref:uncharacterized protein LOC123318850 isoform X2 n=1 Tax=Coccinella septempunctata TaxID=41139 RepID=UPI001D07C4CB|nr:uncharacterized protein LOC123318850 isoform X2 [Coccinella septempunctata]
MPSEATSQRWAKIRGIIGNVCKERWNRIRDNYRKALNLRRTKSDQGVSNLKAPKYSQELSFLIPYFTNDEERQSNLSPEGVDSNLEEVKVETPPDFNNLYNNEANDTQDSLSISSVISSRTVGKKSECAASQGPNAANVIPEYSSETALNRSQSSDPLLHFFINMAETVKTFPVPDQVTIKAQLFQMVNEVEMRLALQ